MNFTYENQGGNSYLVYKLDKNEQLDNLSYGMLSNNDIPHVASIQYLQADEKRLFRYNISSKVNVSQYFTGLVTRKRFLGVLRSIGKALLSAEDYMIEPSTFVLDLDYIFVDVSSAQADLICLPIDGLSRDNVDLKEMFKNLLFNLQFDQSEDSNYVADVLNLLNSMQIFSLSKFVEKIDELYIDSESKANKKTDKQENSALNTNSQTSASSFTNYNVQSQANNFNQNRPNNSVDNYGQDSSNYQNNSNLNDNLSDTHNQSQFQQPSQPHTPLTEAAPTNSGQAQQNLTNANGQGYQANAEQNAASNFNTENNNSKPKVAGKKKKGKSDNKSEEPKVLYDEDGQVIPELPPMTIMKQLKRIFVIDPEEEEIRKKRKKALKRWKESQENGVSEARTVPGAPTQNKFTIPSNTPEAFKSSFSNKNNQNPNQAQGNGANNFSSNNQGQNGNFNLAPDAPNFKQTNNMQNNQAGVNNQSAHSNSQGNYSQSNYSSNSSANNYSQASSTEAFGETTVLGGVQKEETKAEIKPFLIRTKNNERIILNKPLFRLGKEKNYVDYCISDNSAISRSHATLSSEGDKWFIEDTNSLNHTYVNGEQIPSNTKVPLTHGNAIILGNENFEFRLY